MNSDSWRKLAPIPPQFSLRGYLEALLLLGILLAVAYSLQLLLAKEVTMPSGGSQAHYHSPELPKAEQELEILAWYELGKNGGFLYPRLSPKHFAADSLRILLPEFTLAPPWQREVSWHLKANGSGTISVYFPQHAAPTHLAIFMTDGDSHWRSSRIYSASSQQLAERLHLGKWFYFPVTEEEKRVGKKVLRIQQLTGADIGISAVMLIGAKGAATQSLVDDSQNNASEAGSEATGTN